MLFPVPGRVKDIRATVHQFMTERVEPAEPALNAGDRGVLRDLREQAKKEGLWALGHPKELGGGGLP